MASIMLDALLKNYAVDYASINGTSRLIGTATQSIACLYVGMHRYF